MDVGPFQLVCVKSWIKNLLLISIAIYTDLVVCQARNGATLFSYTQQCATNSAAQIKIPSTMHMHYMFTLAA